jgi:hypothetical protein
LVALIGVDEFIFICSVLVALVMGTTEYGDQCIRKIEWFVEFFESNLRVPELSRYIEMIRKSLNGEKVERIDPLILQVIARPLD